jgi:hypothetical protein
MKIFMGRCDLLPWLEVSCVVFESARQRGHEGGV